MAGRYASICPAGFAAMLVPLACFSAGLCRESNGWCSQSDAGERHSTCLIVASCIFCLFPVSVRKIWCQANGNALQEGQSASLAADHWYLCSLNSGDPRGVESSTQPGLIRCCPAKGIIMFFVKRSLSHVRKLYIDDLTSNKMSVTPASFATCEYFMH